MHTPSTKRALYSQIHSFAGVDQDTHKHTHRHARVLGLNMKWFWLNCDRMRGIKVRKVDQTQRVMRDLMQTQRSSTLCGKGQWPDPQRFVNISEQRHRVLIMVLRLVRRTNPMAPPEEKFEKTVNILAPLRSYKAVSTACCEFLHTLKVAIVKFSVGHTAASLDFSHWRGLHQSPGLCLKINWNCCFVAAALDLAGTQLKWKQKKSAI